MNIYGRRMKYAQEDVSYNFFKVHTFDSYIKVVFSKIRYWYVCAVYSYLTTGD